MMWVEYLRQLQAWCDSLYGLPQVRAVLFYLEKGCLIKDLIEAGILFAGPDGKLMKKWTGAKEEIPPIFQIVTGGDQTETLLVFVLVERRFLMILWFGTALYNIICLS